MLPTLGCRRAVVGLGNGALLSAATLPMRLELTFDLFFRDVLGVELSRDFPGDREKQRSPDLGRDLRRIFFSGSTTAAGLPWRVTSTDSSPSRTLARLLRSSLTVVVFTVGLLISEKCNVSR
ncbi:MAG TPA: hypothetical protein VMS56_07180 [Thermoanaerobaculia bacterium]|nr:hypothetical protein [Thermoanaerobaculia bacterium]